jgi:hypothetical protein
MTVPRGFSDRGRRRPRWHRTERMPKDLVTLPSTSFDKGCGLGSRRYHHGPCDANYERPGTGLDVSRPGWRRRLPAIPRFWNNFCIIWFSFEDRRAPQLPRRLPRHTHTVPRPVVALSGPSDYRRFWRLISPTVPDTQPHQDNRGLSYARLDTIIWVNIQLSFL